PTLFVQCNASVPAGCVSPPKYVSKSCNVYPVRSLYGSNYPARQSYRAICESQKSSCHKRVEPAKQRNPVPEWKQYPECKQSPKWKQSSSWSLAKTHGRAACRRLEAGLGSSRRPLVEWRRILLL